MIIRSQWSHRVNEHKKKGTEKKWWRFEKKEPENEHQCVCQELVFCCCFHTNKKFNFSRRNCFMRFLFGINLGARKKSNWTSENHHVFSVKFHSIFNGQKQSMSLHQIQIRFEISFEKAFKIHSKCNLSCDPCGRAMHFRIFIHFFQSMTMHRECDTMECTHTHISYASNCLVSTADGFFFYFRGVIAEQAQSHWQHIRSITATDEWQQPSNNKKKCHRNEWMNWTRQKLKRARKKKELEKCTRNMMSTSI